jgi:ubiquinone/menaquinone biosynthesis C-methylase UbiE
MSKFRKTVDYVVGALKHPDLFKYYISKVFKYKKLGYSDELLYWKHEMKKHSLDWSQKMQLKDIYFSIKYIEDKFKINGKNIKCLDLGSGPRSRLTLGYDANKFDLLAVDPLADEYIREFGGRNFLRVGTGEELANLYDSEFFHVVYSCNAIDHSDSPPEVINAITKVLKKDGLLMVCGNIKNGCVANWLGLHQHNLWIENESLMWQTKEMNEKETFINITDKHIYTCMKQYTTLFTEDGNNIPWFMGIWRKNNV